jgi:hypothetical protein
MSSQDLFVKDFIALRDGTIQPALLDIGRQLQEHGHKYEIGEGLPLKPPIPGAVPPYAGITLEVYPSDVDWDAIEGLRPFNKVPSITFGVDLSARKVTVFVNPRCESGRSILRVGQRTIGSVNSYRVDEVTREIVHRELREFFTTIPFEVELK